MQQALNKNIISASRRTDIPAFFADWFERQLKQNYCEYPNPLFPQKKYKVSLLPEDLAGFVFWTRYPIPFLGALQTILQRNDAFYFHFTLNNYPKMLERQNPPKENAISAAKKLAHLIGKERIIWRYDPIIITNELDIVWHKQNFRSLLKELSPYISLITISIIDFYNFNKNHLLSLSVKKEKEYYLELLIWMSHTSKEYGLTIQSCAEDLPKELGIVPAGCIDAAFLAKSNDRTIMNPLPPLHKLRKKCLCHKSIDIGTNNTCRFGCIYCYANNLNNHNSYDNASQSHF